MGALKPSLAYLAVRNQIADVLESALKGELSVIKVFSVASRYYLEGEYPRMWVTIAGAEQQKDLRTTQHKYFTMDLDVVVAFKFKDLVNGESQVTETLLNAFDVLEDGIMSIDFVRSVELDEFNPNAGEIEDEDLRLASMSISVLYLTK